LEFRDPESNFTNIRRGFFFSEGWDREAGCQRERWNWLFTLVPAAGILDEFVDR